MNQVLEGASDEMLVWLDPSESCGERRKQCSLTPLDVPSTSFSVVNPYRLKLVLLILIVFFKIPDSQMTELEIGSPIWDDVPQERPVWDDQGSNESSNTGHRSRRISSISSLSQHSLEPDQSPPAHPSQVELQISEMLPKLAEQIAMMKITNPEVLRVTPAFCAFEQCALALRGECERDLFFKSRISHKISTFWSHSWHGGQWKLYFVSDAFSIEIGYRGPKAHVYGCGYT